MDWNEFQSQFKNSGTTPKQRSALYRQYKNGKISKNELIRRQSPVRVRNKKSPIRVRNKKSPVKVRNRKSPVRRRSPNRRKRSPTKKEEHEQHKVHMLKASTKLNRLQQKWCRCVLEVAAKQGPQCLKNKMWFKTVNGAKCYNPYAICSSSVGTSVRGCSTEYNYIELYKNELLGLAYLKGIKVNPRDTKSSIISAIKKRI